MDAYIPTSETVKPAFFVPENDQPWRQISGTQTLMWYPAVKPAEERTLSSSNKAVTHFIVLDNPSHAGLNRLRTFRDWPDNWDAEGSKAPDNQVLEFATKVFGLLCLYRVPSVTLSADGLPMFVYGAPIRGEVVVTSTSTIDYFFADDGAPEGDGVPVDHGALPSELVEYLRNA